MRTLLILALFLPLMAWAQSALPPCPASGYKHECIEEVAGNTWINIQEYRHGRAHGLGIEYTRDGSIRFAGHWEEDRLIKSIPLDLENEKQFGAYSRLEWVRKSQTDRITTTNRLQLLFGSTIRSIPWKDRLDRVVQSELRNWFAPQNAGLDEIPTPSYPAALSLKQEPWETNKEFEDRVEKARTERRLAIERLQAEYLARWKSAIGALPNLTAPAQNVKLSYPKSAGNWWYWVSAS